MKQMNKTITKNMLIADLVESYPELVEKLTFDYGLHCIGCMAASEETLEEGATVHGMKEKEINKMIEELNEAVKNQKNLES
jgi:hybrid cluster-associated redox disulfide protein